MTRVYLERDGNLYTLSAQGHATGSVEVCAAVSALIQTLRCYLMGREAMIYDRMTDGAAFLTLRIDDPAPFDMVCCGLQCLEKTAPDKISVEIQEIS